MSTIVLDLYKNISCTYQKGNTLSPNSQPTVSFTLLPECIWSALYNSCATLAVLYPHDHDHDGHWYPHDHDGVRHAVNHSV